MKKIIIDENRKCPYCGKIENQIRMRYNKSSTQRCKCKECNKTYTLDPKETKKLALVLKMYYSGVSGRGVGKKGTAKTRENVYLITMIGPNPRQIVGFDVAFDRSSKRI